MGALYEEHSFVKSLAESFDWRVIGTVPTQLTDDQRKERDTPVLGPYTKRLISLMKLIIRRGAAKP